MTRAARPIVWTWTFVLLTGASGLAQELTLHGFAQANYSLRVSETEETDPEGDFLLGDQRLQLELSRSSESGAVNFTAKADFFHDAVDGDADLDVREAYLTLAGDRFDVRLGRQILTWGVGDLIFINDTFTKDWTALIAGQPLQYLKVGSDGVNLNLYLGPISAQFVLVPFFEPDVLPRGERLVGYNPFPSRPAREVRPRRTAENTEVAFRTHAYVAGFDASFYAYRGFWGSPPGMRFDGSQVTRFYPALSVYGGSVQGGFASGVLGLEAGFYDSRDDPAGTDPAVENSQLRLLTRYERALGDDLTIGVQYYAERMLNHGAYTLTVPRGFPLRSQTRHNGTLRVTRSFNYQTSQVSVFGWVSPNDEDYYVNPELRYGFSDDVWMAVGANFFGGTHDHTFFGQFDRNDNVYVTVRYSF